MPLSAGTRLGPYEILSPLGAGGMGEVYKARDKRLGREVAVKVLSSAVASDAGYLRRFEQEARSVSALSDPHIVTVFDVGEQEGIHYFASELVDGGDLRSRLGEDGIPLRKAVEIAEQIASGMTAAHEKGIVHRDLKPENILLTKSGLVKIADFGLAKIAEAGSHNVSQLPTSDGHQTTAGVVMGTISYMSPEQARGASVDFRSDQFAFGSILYEMLTGKLPFRRETKGEILAAILRDEPAPVSEANPSVPAPLSWIVERCLAKDPQDRYASTRDLARDLRTLRDHLSQATTSGEAIPPTPAVRRARKPYALVAISLLAIAGAYWFGGKRAQRPPPSYHRLTFHRGRVTGARFSPDGQNIVFSAAWDGEPLETFLMRGESSDSRSLGFRGSHLLSISSTAEMALGLGWKPELEGTSKGTLARVALAGGVPREVLEGVTLADWSPDGRNLAVARKVSGKRRLELPIGHTLFEPEGDLDGLRVSPKGDLVAIIVEESNGRSIGVIDSVGRKRTLSSGWNRAEGLAWSPKGNEVWFTASRAGQERALWAVSLSGHDRLVARVPGRLMLHDISRQGTVLLAHEVIRREMIGLAPGESRERDLTWLGYSFPAALSRDGRTLFFGETSEESSLQTLYIRKTDGSPPIRIGEGIAPGISAISPDGRWVFARQPAPGGTRSVLLPTGAGEPRLLAIRGIGDWGDVKWFPDGNRLLVDGSAPGREPRAYVVELSGGEPRPVTPAGVSEAVISPDGKSLIAGDEHGGLSIYPVAGGTARQVIEKAFGYPLQWSADGKSVYVWAYRTSRVDKLDLASGRANLWKEFRPRDPTGVDIVQPMQITPDGNSYVYTYVRVLSDLYLVEGMK